MLIASPMTKTQIGNSSMPKATTMPEKVSARISLSTVFSATVAISLRCGVPVFFSAGSSVAPSFA